MADPVVRQAQTVIQNASLEDEKLLLGPDLQQVVYAHLQIGDSLVRLGFYDELLSLEEDADIHPQPTGCLLGDLLDVKDRVVPDAGRGEGLREISESGASVDEAVGFGEVDLSVIEDLNELVEGLAPAQLQGAAVAVVEPHKDGNSRIRLAEGHPIQAIITYYNLSTQQLRTSPRPDLSTSAITQSWRRKGLRDLCTDLSFISRIRQ